MSFFANTAGLFRKIKLFVNNYSKKTSRVYIIYREVVEANIWRREGVARVYNEKSACVVYQLIISRLFSSHSPISKRSSYSLSRIVHNGSFAKETVESSAKKNALEVVFLA